MDASVLSSRLKTHLWETVNIFVLFDTITWLETQTTRDGVKIDKRNRCKNLGSAHAIAIQRQISVSFDKLN